MSLVAYGLGISPGGGAPGGTYDGVSVLLASAEVEVGLDLTSDGLSIEGETTVSVDDGALVVTVETEPVAFLLDDEIEVEIE